MDIADCNQQFSFAESCLTAQAWGAYPSVAPLANVTIVGLAEHAHSVRLLIGAREVQHVQFTYTNGTLMITSLERHTRVGAWEEAITICLDRDSAQSPLLADEGSEQRFTESA